MKIFLDPPPSPPKKNWLTQKFSSPQKIWTHAENFVPRKRNRIRQKFDPRNNIFDPRQPRKNYFDPRNPRNPRNT